MAPRGPRKGPMRIIAEDFLFQHPYTLTHDCMSVFVPAAGQVRTPICQEYYDYVRTRLINGDGSRVFPEETDDFCKSMTKATAAIRKPFGIVRDWSTSRSKGDPPAHCWKVLKTKFQGPSLQARANRLKRAAANRRYKRTDHGRLVALMHSEHRKKRRKMKRIEKLSQYDIEAFGNQSALDIGKQLVDTPLDGLEGLTPREYGEEYGGVYPFYTGQQTKDDIKLESTRFITEGQRPSGRGHHNAIIMWNPGLVEFPGNICPYKERFDHGLEAINAFECEMLGIFHIIVVDEEISERDGRQIEKGCHQALEELEIPKRIFRVVGAGGGKDVQSVEVDGRKTVGMTFLPPDFFANNPNICVVASAN